MRKIQELIQELNELNIPQEVIADKAAAAVVIANEGKPELPQWLFAKETSKLRGEYYWENIPVR